MYCMRFAALGCLSLALAGCNRSNVPEPVNTDEAGKRLTEALEAWRGGEEYGALARRSPPVIFTEPLWEAGTRLLDFELGPVELHGRQGRCTARLTLQDMDGQRRERSIGYLIDTTPNVVIVREGLGP